MWCLAENPSRRQCMCLKAHFTCGNFDEQKTAYIKGKVMETLQPLLLSGVKSPAFEYTQKQHRGSARETSTITSLLNLISRDACKDC